MKNLVGKCAVCGRRVSVGMSTFVRIDASMNPTHRKEGQLICWSHSRPGAEEGVRAQCLGSYMAPVHDPQLEKQRTRRRAKRFALVEPFRTAAIVAHDAWVDARPFPALDRRILVRVAVYEYGLHFPDVQTVAALRLISAVSRAGHRLRSGDAYCSFCGELRLRGVSLKHRGWMAPERLVALAERDHHAIRCALEHLAHAQVPQPPSVRRLPEEYLEQRDEALA